MKWLSFRKPAQNSKSLIKRMNRFNIRNNNQLLLFYYAFALELKEGGISLIDVGSNDFFSKNWRFMHGRFKNILLTIYDWFLNDTLELNQLLAELSTKINSPEFMKWITSPYFRFIIIKSLHDSTITKVHFDLSKQVLTCIIETKHAIDFVPFNNEVELKFHTRDFKPKNIDDLVEAVEYNGTIIFGIKPYFQHEFLRIELDYTCFINSKDVKELPDLDFICENISIKNL